MPSFVQARESDAALYLDWSQAEPAITTLAMPRRSSPAHQARSFWRTRATSSSEGCRVGLGTSDQQGHHPCTDLWADPDPVKAFGGVAGHRQQPIPSMTTSSARRILAPCLGVLSQYVGYIVNG